MFTALYAAAFGQEFVDPYSIGYIDILGLCEGMTIGSCDAIVEVNIAVFLGFLREYEITLMLVILTCSEVLRSILSFGKRL